MYKGSERDFCLPIAYCEENLAPDIRARAIDYFKTKGIVWHQGHGDKPNNHMCSSQVCCVNFLFPFAQASEESLVELLHPIYPTIKSIMPMDDMNLTFEWIGKENYLGEKIRGARTRGANVTSADAAVMFEHQDGSRQFVLIEWKYTESVGNQSLKIAASGTNRSEIYRKLYIDPTCNQ